MSDKVKFDVEINKKFSDNIIINYGIVNGNNTIVFIKAGQDGSLYGYQDKYIKSVMSTKEERGG